MGLKAGPVGVKKTWQLDQFLPKHGSLRGLSLTYSMQLHAASLFTRPWRATFTVNHVVPWRTVCRSKCEIRIPAILLASVPTGPTRHICHRPVDCAKLGPGDGYRPTTIICFERWSNGNFIRGREICPRLRSTWLVQAHPM